MTTDFDDFNDDHDTPTEDDLNTCYGSKYLSAADLGDKKARTRIAKIRKEMMRQQDGKEKSKFVVYFTTINKPLVLNGTNKDALVEALGRKPADWLGAEVGLYTAPTQFTGKPTKGVRLRVLSASKPEPKPAAAPKPAPEPAATAAAVEAEMPWEDPEDPGHTGEEVDFTEAAE
jgi:hypothetical protein